MEEKAKGSDWRRIGYFDNGTSYVITFHMPSEFKYETWVKNPQLNNGNLKTQESYIEENQALLGHEKWLRTVREIDRQSKPKKNIIEIEDMPDIVFTPQEDAELDLPDTSNDDTVADIFVGKDLSEVKISFNALMRILYNYVHERHITVQGSPENPLEVILTLDQGPFQGGCIYDWSTLTARNISSRWQFLIEETKSDVLDKRAAKILRAATAGIV